VITDWNAVAVATIVVDAGKANAEAFLWYAFEQAAVYNAVVGITREYDLYRWKVRGPTSASPEAAAAAAAHRVLLTYFPASEPRLSAAYSESLENVPDGPAKDQGIRYGERAARHIIRIRADDGRFADIVFDEPLAPGVWRPTPPTFTPFFDPWLSKVDPLMLRSPRQFRPGPPPGLRSDVYTDEYNEVKAFGEKVSAVRTPSQTETALFFSDIGIVPIQAGLRDLVTRHGMNISDSARLFAAVDVSIADGAIATWDAKFHYGWWRPITAIQLGYDDTNPDTVGKSTWEPLLTNPPYPDYSSGLSSVIGATTRSLVRVLDLGGGRIDLNLTSAAAGVTRHYEFAGQLRRDVIDARVWGGIHFRTADVVGVKLGNRVTRWGLDRNFGPLGY
jgi:hypothetical protein